jgi:uncharacterized protein
VFSPTDLNHFLECEHLIQIERSRDRRLPRPPRDAHADLLAAKGAEHEAARLAQFRSSGRQVVTIAGPGTDRPPSPGALRRPGDWAAEAARTAEVMRAGADVIYQGVFATDAWRGVSDFLVRVEQPSILGSWSYEAWDTKLARRTKPYFVLQLCFYSEQLAAIQQLDPEWMVVVLGTGHEERLRYPEFASYYRAVRRRFVERADSRLTTYPYPVSHCRLCEYDASCRNRREADDHLSLVAGIRRAQVERLQDAGVLTVAALAATESSTQFGIGPTTFERLRHQAALQTRHRQEGVHAYELLAADERSGFRLMPRPSPGDIFFDMEGDPYFEPARGLEYLFGAVTLSDAGEPGFQAFRALTREEEKRAFEQFIDFLHDRLRRYPDLHVYHYAPYETSALKRLMSEHATRETELDDLLRRELFVDLYQVVRQSLRISHQSYSIKKVRTFFTEEGRGHGARSADQNPTYVVTDGGDSVLQFERWRTTGDAAILEAIERYNEEDCVSTLRLRDWLLERRAEAGQASGLTIPWKPVEVPEERPEREAEDERTRARRERLTALAAESDSPTGSLFVPQAGGEGLQLLADLLLYHRREAKPEYWAYFERRKRSLDELMDDTQAIANLEPVEEAPRAVAKSLVHTLRFPPQEFKLNADPKAQVEDPFRQSSAGCIEWLDSRRGLLGLKRGAKRLDDPLPLAVIAGPPLDTRMQRAALGRVADALIDGTGRYQAVCDILDRRAPRLRQPAASVLQTTTLAGQQALVAGLDHSYLFVQGPPGSGKTWTGARLIVSLIAAGHRVGVAANSHKAINNLLHEVDAVAVTEGVTLRGLKKGSGADALDGRLITDTDSNEACETADVNLIAGTAWLFSRPAMDGRLDYLFIDEAGQVALADTLAMATSARNVIVLGDPQQLPHVRQGLHPNGAGRSVLEHLLNGSATVGAERGLFLERSWRMHPAICAFVSSLSYEGRLRSAPGCERQAIHSTSLSGSGLRYLPVFHEGNAQQSIEEARAVAAEVRTLLAEGSWTDGRGTLRRLTPADILVVAPYNMHVRCLQEWLPDGVEAGTVDRFQGREAAVVFFCMASSTGEDVPRGVDFLFSRNRFNVAVSRAKAMAVVVSSPRLMETRCRSVDQMQLVNALCAFVEAATAQGCTVR